MPIDATTVDTDFAHILSDGCSATATIGGASVSVAVGTLDARKLMADPGLATAYVLSIWAKFASLTVLPDPPATITVAGVAYSALRRYRDPSRRIVRYDLGERYAPQALP